MDIDQARRREERHVGGAEDRVRHMRGERRAEEDKQDGEGRSSEEEGEGEG
jgi:hypothetical protein